MGYLHSIPCSKRKELIFVDGNLNFTAMKVQTVEAMHCGSWGKQETHGFSWSLGGIAEETEEDIA
jgi:hypothetical protein